MRIVIETPCEHGLMPSHLGYCPAASRRILPEGSLVISKENGRWPIAYIWSDDAVDVITHYLDALAEGVAVGGDE